MSDHFPNQADPFLLASSAATVDHSFTIKEFERVATLLLEQSGTVTVHLRFGVDGAQIPFLSGALSVNLQIPCQRCMEAMTVPVESSFNMGLIRSEDESKLLSEQYEPLLVDGKAFSLLEFVEDELILAIPVVVTHEPDECSASRYLQDSTVIEDGKERENPFQILQHLKSD